MTNPTGDALKASAAQVPVGWLYQFKDEKPIFMSEKRDWAEGHAFWKETALFAASISPVEQAPQPVAVETDVTATSACMSKLVRLTSNTGRDHRTGQEFVHAGSSQETVDAMREALGLLSTLHTKAPAAPTEAPPVESQTAGWQPITTAPISNGSNSFLAYITGHGPHVCYAGAGRYIYSVSTGKRIHRATHWMTFPPPPALAAEGSAE